MTLFLLYGNKQGTQNSLPKCINILFFFITFLYKTKMNISAQGN